MTAEIHALYSDRDAFGGSEIDEKFARLAAVHNDIQFHTIVGAGHWSPYEAPDQVNNVLLAMLADR